MSVRVVIDPQRLAAELRSPNGPVMRRLIEVAQRVQDLAKERVGVSRGAFLGAAGTDLAAENPGGHLRDAIVKRVDFEGGRPSIKIGVFAPRSVVERGWFHHQGTRPHRIQGNPTLVFFWPKTARVMFLGHVNHPGTRPNPFLSSALRDAAAGLI